MTEKTQPVPETNEKKSRGVGVYVAWVFVAMMVYVLSSGPVMKWGSKQKRPYQAVRLAYAPLVWVYGRTPLWKPLGIYWHIWAPEYFDKDGDFTH
jgi:hypothetical protein